MPFPAFFLLAAALGGRDIVRGERGRRRTLELEAERQNEINNIDLGLETAGVENEFDARQVEMFQRQQRTAQALLGSKDPRQQALGANMIADLDSAARQFVQQNETEFRGDKVRREEAEVAAAGVGKAANERRLAQELTMQTQLNNDLKGWNDAAVTFGKVMNLLDQDDQLASLAGLTAFVQGIDNSVVREGELIKYQGANGLIIRFVNLINKAEGKDFDENTKISIRNAAAALVNSEKARAEAITNSYQARALMSGLRPDVVLAGVDKTLFTPVIIDKEAQLARQAEIDAAQAAAEGVELEEVAPSLSSRIISPVISGSQDVLADVRRNLTGAKLLRGQNGELFEEKRDGTRTLIGRDDTWTTADGRTLKLIDEGEGNFKWVEIESPGFFEKLFSEEERQERRRRFPNIRQDPNQ